jgi:hypothetical protein
MALAFHPELIFTFGNTADNKSTYYFSTLPPFQHRPLGLIAHSLLYFRIKFMDPLIDQSLDYSATLAKFYIKPLYLYHIHLESEKPSCSLGYWILDSYNG